MQTIIAFVLAHSTSIALFAAWNFSACLSSMPPLSENAGYFTRWLHDYAQLVAANLNRRTTTTTFVQTPAASLQKTETSGPAVETIQPH